MATLKQLVASHGLNILVECEETGQELLICKSVSPTLYEVWDGWKKFEVLKECSTANNYKFLRKEQLQKHS